MSKEHNIKWRRSDYSKLSHLERRVNKKIYGVEVFRPDIADVQPVYVDYQEMKAKIKTRKDFNNLVKKYERYLKEGAEELVTSSRGARATAWEVNEFNIAQRAENVRRANLRKQLEQENVTIGGKNTGVKRAEMGSILDNATRASKKKFKNMSQNDWKQAFENFDRKMFSSYADEMREKYLRNYVKGLIAEGYNNELVEMMNKIPMNKFQRLFYSDEIATIGFIYDPIELKDKNDRLIEFWSEHVDENTNNNINVAILNEEIADEYERGERVKGQGRIHVIRRRKRRK